MSAYPRIPHRPLGRSAVALALGLILAGATGCGEYAGTATAAPGAQSTTAQNLATRDENPVGGPPICSRVSDEQILAATGIGVGEGSADRDGSRAICSYPGTGAGPSITIATAPVQRFAERVAVAQRATGARPVPVPDLGSEARFWFTVAGRPTGLATLVAHDPDRTVEVTVAGLTDPSRARESATTIARTALRTR